MLLAIQRPTLVPSFVLRSRSEKQTALPHHNHYFLLLAGEMKQGKLSRCEEQKKPSTAIMFAMIFYTFFSALFRFVNHKMFTKKSVPCSCHEACIISFINSSEYGGKKRVSSRTKMEIYLLGTSREWKPRLSWEGDCWAIP